MLGRWRIAIGASVAAAAIVIACSSFETQPGLETSDSGSEASADDPDAATNETSTPTTCAVAQPGTGNGEVATDETDCDGIQVLLRSNENHCGLCGRKCPGRCVDGICEAQKILGVGDLEPSFNVTSLDADRYYIIGNIPSGKRRLFEVLKGSGATTAVGPDETTLYAADDGNVVLIQYISNASHIDAIPKDGGPLVPIVPSTGEISGVGIRKDDIVISQRAGGNVASFPKDGKPSKVIANPTPSPLHVVADDEAVAWLNVPRLRIDEDGGPGRLTRVMNSSGAVTKTLDLTLPSALCADATHYYFFEAESGEMRRIPKDGVSNTTGEVISKWTGTPRFVFNCFVQDDFVYFMFGNLSQDRITEVVRVARCGGAPHVISKAGHSSLYVVEGKKVIYGLDGAIWSFEL